MEQFLKPVAPGKAYRMFNLGATALVGAAHEGVSDVMTAAWNCPLDLDPCKVTVVIDKSHFTRVLMEKSGYFVLALPGAGIARETLYLGSVSKNDEADKLAKSGAEFFDIPSFKGIPLVRGCACYALFRIIPEPHNQQAYDLFIGELVEAWADDRVLRDGHWDFSGHDALRTLHYVAGGHFKQIGEPLEVEL